jgi:hypothetical protein
MKIKTHYFYAGIIVLTFLGVSYFISFNVDTGNNYETYDSLLGIIIFHNPFILCLYILFSAVLIYNGLKSRKMKGGKK